MIRLKVSVGSGDKPATSVNDPLISELWMARERAKQELTPHRTFSRLRELSLPFDPVLDIGVYKEVLVTSLGISGLNEITGLSLSIGSSGIIEQQVTVFQLGGLVE